MSKKWPRQCSHSIVCMPKVFEFIESATRKAGGPSGLSGSEALEELRVSEGYERACQPRHLSGPSTPTLSQPRGCNQFLWPRFGVRAGNKRWKISLALSHLEQKTLL